MPAPTKVLIVEDEFILYDELAEFFQDKGFKIAGYNESEPVDTYSKAIEILHKEEPDFAVLDISIKGDKDGLEIGDYIKKHFNIPIIFLTAFDNYQNMERASGIAADAFVLKHEKPLNKNQLWADVRRLKSRIEKGVTSRAQGKFLKLKEIDTNLLEKKHTALHQRPSDPVEIETYLKWDDIKMIVSYNKISNNNILIYSRSSNKGYFYRGTLNDIEIMLPEYFVRFNQSTIVNLNAITAKGKTQHIYYLGDIRVDISDKYKEEALGKINLHLIESR